MNETHPKFPILHPVNDEPQYWLHGDPARASVTCRLEQHDWVTVPQPNGDYYVCDDCGKRRGWTENAKKMAELSVKNIRILSDKSILKTRRSISIYYSDGRHLAVVPAKSYGTSVKPIEEVCLKIDEQVLVRVSIEKGNNFVIQRSDPQAPALLPDYIRAAFGDEKNWLRGEHFDYIRNVMSELRKVYPQPVN